MIGHLNLRQPRGDCGLHPLIHTLLDFALVQDMASCQRHERKPQPT